LVALDWELAEAVLLSALRPGFDWKYVENFWLVAIVEA
jgi:hypothetical protein